MNSQDKRAAVEQALHDHPELSERELAKRCGVSWDMVCTAKKRLGMKASRRTLPVNLLSLDESLQMRADGVDNEYADELAQLLKDDADFELPEVTVFEDQDGTLRVPDGFHRCKAYHLAGRERIPVKVMKGGRREAWLHALGANEDHGKRRGPKDREKAIKAALEDSELAQLDNTVLGRMLHVHRGTIRRYREFLAGRSAGLTPASQLRDRSTTQSQAAPAKPRCQEPFRRPGAIPCADCDQSFDRMLWHCPSCSRHWLPKDAECGECGTARPMTEKEYDLGEERILEGQAESVPQADSVRSSAAEGTARLAASGPPEPVREVVHDALGRQVPDGLIEVFKRLTPFRSMIQRLGAIKSELADLKSHGIATDFLRVHEIHPDLDNAQKAIRFSMPYAVCPKCQGQRCKGKESLCAGLGWIREDQYGRLSDQQKAS